MKILTIEPELLVEDMTKTLKFYRELLGFNEEVIFPENSPIFAQVEKDKIRIMLYLRSDFEKEIPKIRDIKMGGSILLYFRVEKISDFYNEMKEKVKIIQMLHKTDYSSLEFTMEDCNGYLICFSEKTSS